MCDIEAMFHQVRVDESHRDLLRFLWWEDGEVTREPEEYTMAVHLLGATSLLGCANFALKSTPNDYESEFSVATTDCLRNDFYIDYSLKSVLSIDEAVTLISDVKQRCKSGGFNLINLCRIVKTSAEEY